FLARLDIEVPQNLEVVRDEPDRAEEHLLDTLRMQPLQLVDDVRSEPRLPGRALTLEGEAPVLDVGSLRDEPRRLEQLVAVRIALLENPSGKRIRREHDVCIRTPDPVSEHVE